MEKEGWVRGHGLVNRCDHMWLWHKNANEGTRLCRVATYLTTTQVKGITNLLFVGSI